jgi:methionyl-tRNA formyltransferase
MPSTERPLLLLSSRPWNAELAERITSALERPIHTISKAEELQLESILALDPEWIFVPHWSDLIPKSIWNHWPTVIFHMTDLPYGRGGSPLQNLIQRGHSNTMLSALRCSKELDAGPIYCKEPLSLQGTAEEIFIRADSIIESMIKRIVKQRPDPKPQEGEPVLFKRRKPEESNLKDCAPGDLASWFDQIRMLDAEGYPHAFLEVHGCRMEFRRVSRRSGGLHADVVIKPISASSTEPPQS